ncbi:RRM domain-containing protein, partial [Trichonephila inaurata madagascariensis]
GKKAFQVDNDSSSDFDEDSGEEMIVQKTPKNKTSQSRISQSMSAKKVSFELSGKKTPRKTPQKNNSFIGKKQPTPVAKGMKGNKSVQKKKSQSEEMDDDDDDDDDFDMDMDEDDEEEDVAKKSKKPTTPKANTPKNEIKKKSSSKEEDDSDDSVEDEEEEQIQKQKNMKTPKANTPKNKSEENDDSEKMAAVKEMDAQRRKEENLRTLFVGNLPNDVTLDDLEALSSDFKIVFARIHPNMRKKYAFITFASEEKARANYTALQGKELKGQVLNVDYNREKGNRKSEDYQWPLNVKELHINGIPQSVTVGDVATLFPKACLVKIIYKKDQRSVLVGFKKVEDADEAYNLKEIELGGRKLFIYHATMGYPNKYKGKRTFEPSKKFPSNNDISKVRQRDEKYNPAKKMKFSKKN